MKLRLGVVACVLAAFAVMVTSVSAFQNLGNNHVTNYDGVWQGAQSGSMHWAEGATGSGTGVSIVGPAGTGTNTTFAYVTGEWTPGLTGCSYVLLKADLGGPDVATTVQPSIRVRLWASTDMGQTPIVDEILTSPYPGSSAWDINDQTVGVPSCSNLTGTNAVRVDALGSGSSAIPEGVFKDLRIYGNCNGGLNQTCATFTYADLGFESVTPFQRSMSWCFDNQADSGLEQDVKDAAAIWTYYTQPYFGFVYEGECNGDLTTDPGDEQPSCATVAQFDAVNEFGTFDVSDSGSPLGLTSITANCTTGEVLEADMWLNTGRSVSYLPRLGLAIHEFGHALGLSNCSNHSDYFSPCGESDDSTVGIHDPCDPLTINSVFCDEGTYTDRPSPDDVAGAMFIYRDTDGDGCTGLEEHAASHTHGGQRSDANRDDFADVPVPFLGSNPAGAYNRQVGESTSEANAVWAAFVAGWHSGESGYDGDVNVNGIPDGEEYDNSAAPDANKPWALGGPDGAVTAADANRQFVLYRDGYHDRCDTGP